MELALWKNKRVKNKFPKDAENGLSYSKMVHEVNEQHMRITEHRKNGQERKYMFPLCTSIGGFLEATKIENYGVGITLYFKFMVTRSNIPV